MSSANFLAGSPNFSALPNVWRPVDGPKITLEPQLGRLQSWAVTLTSSLSPAGPPERINAAGETITALAAYLGHSDPAFTLRVYTHVMPSSEERTRRAVDGVFRACVAER